MPKTGLLEPLHGLPVALGRQVVAPQPLVALPLPLPQLVEVLLGVAEPGGPGNVLQAVLVLGQPPAYLGGSTNVVSQS